MRGVICSVKSYKSCWFMLHHILQSANLILTLVSVILALILLGIVLNSQNCIWFFWRQLRDVLQFLVYFHQRGFLGSAKGEIVKQFSIIFTIYLLCIITENQTRTTLKRGIFFLFSWLCYWSPDIALVILFYFFIFFLYSRSVAADHRTSGARQCCGELHWSYEKDRALHRTTGNQNSQQWRRCG